jgi:hypothetical protein
LSSEIGELAKRDAGCERLISIPGIGPIISSAMAAAIGAGDAFAKGRDFATWLGLVLKQISTGDRTIQGKISKRGNRYLRVLFVQAAWVVLVKMKPARWESHGSSLGSRLPRSGFIATCWPSRSPISSSASTEVYLPGAEPSRRASFKPRDNNYLSYIPAGVCEKTRGDGGSVFPAPANTGDPDGPVEADPLMRLQAR